MTIKDTKEYNSYVGSSLEHVLQQNKQALNTCKLQRRRVILPGSNRLKHVIKHAINEFDYVCNKRKNKKVTATNIFMPISDIILVLHSRS